MNIFELSTEQSIAIKLGLFKQIAPTELIVWMTIQAHITEGNEIVSQRELAKVTGFHVSTINKCIQNLLDMTINGQHIMHREMFGLQGRQVSHFSIPIEDKIENKPMTWTAKTIISRFCTSYNDFYGAKYNPTWGRDTTMVQNKLAGKYTDEELEGIIEIAIKEFPRRWANGQYQRPSIGMLCGWLTNQALPIWQDRKLQDARIDDTQQQDLDRFDNGVI